MAVALEGFTTPRTKRRITGWPRGPKPKRRTELGLLVFASLITVALYVVAEVGKKNHIPPHLGPILGVILGLALVAHIANRWLVPDANAVLLPLAVLLNGVGYVLIVRLTPGEAHDQATWAAVGIVVYIGVLLFVRRSRDLDRYRYLLLLLAVLLLVSPLIPHVGLAGTNTSGNTHLWVKLGAIQFQPFEIAKILLVVFFASYFADKKELLSIPTARVGNRLYLDPRPMVPVLLFWGFTMAVIGVEDDIGFAMLTFAMFVVLLWITTGRWIYIFFSLVLFAGGAVAADHFFSQVRTRIDTWLHPAANSQLAYVFDAIAHGGILGSGLGLDHYVNVTQLPVASTDMIFGVLTDELGFVGAAAVVLAFILMVGAGLRTAQVARSDFSRLVAVGLTTILGCQAFFIMAGVLRILPLTGIVLPFIAYGGSSLVANYALIAILMRIAHEGSSTAAERAMGVSLPGETGFRPAS